MKEFSRSLPESFIFGRMQLFVACCRFSDVAVWHVLRFLFEGQIYSVRTALLSDRAGFFPRGILPFFVVWENRDQSFGYDRSGDAADNCLNHSLGAHQHGDKGNRIRSAKFLHQTLNVIGSVEYEKM